MKWARRQYKTGHKQKLYLTSAAVFVLIALISPIFVTASASAASVSPAASIPTTFAATVADDDPCDATGNPLSWVICPIVGILHEGTKVMDAAINHLMEVDATSIFDRNTDSGKAYYAAWNSFRIFGIGLIVIAGLVMVISQALGFDFFDAYTVKKVLPRLVLAIIGISLSWWLMWFLTNFTNDVGTGVRSVIYYPFKDMGDGAGIQSLGTQSLELLAVGGGAIFLGIGGLLSLLATAALAALVAFLVLVIRQIVIVFLILLAPLAIACYVLPNTEKVYKLWWDSLSKALMMFPIITAFIATGHVFSAVASSNPSSSYGLTQIVALLAYFMPYFALPFTFRLAGGALATLGGLTNDRSRGAFDALKNKRKAIAADRFARAQSQSLWDNNNPIGRRANKLATWATDPVSNAAYYGRNVPGLKKRGHKIAGQIEHAGVEQSGKLFEELNKMGYNDRAYRALSGVHSGLDAGTQERLRAANLFGKSPGSISDIQKMGDILSQSTNDNERLGGNAITASAGRLATLYQDQEMTKANIGAAGIMGLAAHGFASGKDLRDAGNMLSGGKYNSETGKIEGMKEESAGFAQSIVSQAQLMGSRSRPDVKPGYGVMYQDGKFVDGMTEAGRDLDVIQTLSSSDIAGAKGGAFETLEPTYKEILKPSSEQIQGASYFDGLDERARKTLQAEQPDTFKKLRRNSTALKSQQAAKDQLFQWAGPYSQASVDIKNRALQLIEDVGLGEEYQATLRTQMSPEQLEAARRAGMDPEQQGGGGGPQNPGGR